MKRLLLLALLLAACTPVSVQVPVPPAETVPPTSAPPTSVPPTEVFTPVPTFTSTPDLSSASYIDLENDGKTVAYDFTEHLCEAHWTNSVDPKGVPCPGDLSNVSKGYVGLLSGSDAGLDAGLPMILAFPAYDNAGGIFGRFPKFTIGPNDEFRVSLTCRSNSNCYISFSLGYYTANGKYQEPFPIEYIRITAEPPQNYVMSLKALAGQTVEFNLVVRAEGFPTEAWALLIQPRILR